MRVEFIKVWHLLDYDWLAINGEIKIANCNGNLNMCPIGMISRAQGSIDHHISQQSCNERAYQGYAIAIQPCPLGMRNSISHLFIG